MNEYFAYWMTIALDCLPVVFVITGWVFAVRSRGTRKWTHLWPLIAVTVSILWLDAGLIWPRLWGFSHSHLRSIVIDGNFLLMMIAAIGAFSRRSRSTIATGIAAAVIGMAWAFLSAINAAV
jgi:hypothetical protein